MENRPRPRVPLWETVAIFAALASLWPAYILRLPGPLWRILSHALLAVMLVIFVRRVLAFRRLSRELKEEQRKRSDPGVHLPWEPPPGPPPPT